jgi:UDP-GlcNAc:undecaprenyl-phosphate GlcNAc-1-phosphate transferase
MEFIAASFFALVLSLVLTPVVRSASRVFGMVAMPRVDRWHHRPTALLGGIAIYLAFIAGCLVFAPHAPGVKLIMGAGTMLFAIGLTTCLRSNHT